MWPWGSLCSNKIDDTGLNLTILKFYFVELATIDILASWVNFSSALFSCYWHHSVQKTFVVRKMKIKLISDSEWVFRKRKWKGLVHTVKRLLDNKGRVYFWWRSEPVSREKRKHRDVFWRWYEFIKQDRRDKDICCRWCWQPERKRNRFASDGKVGPQN